ncbi:MAG: histidine phosphatase family protein [Acidocella sp. 20-57-95]|nr:MAG: histidine phosphatase family protein [Acidocella sp. 20-57-95]OYV57850.1 MAG: histidine phosphatase family protein [Acidocella sp. 21-58-7]HQT63893.1 histidine phosphatase family protein [Acidocella sp.]HQU05462.1 histidine phosphatase family protein [Acidocella sp.]
MYLLRHGQSLFNLHYSATKRDPGIADPELTPLGHEQAARAAAKLADKAIKRVIISPYTRALQTAAAVLQVHKVPVEIMTGVRERFAFSCDIGRPPHELAASFPEHEFGHLPDKWWPDSHETEAATIARARLFREEMQRRDDAHDTLLVSHWAFILALTGVSAANGEIVEYDLVAPVAEEIVWRP